MMKKNHVLASTLYKWKIHCAVQSLVLVARKLTRQKSDLLTQSTVVMYGALVS